MDEMKLEVGAETTISDIGEPVRETVLAEVADAVDDGAKARPPSSQAAQQDKLVSIETKLGVQSDLLQSSHNLLVDIAGKIVKMSDEAVWRAIRPVFIDLILLYDSLQQARSWVSSAAEIPKAAFEDRLGVLETELLEILARRDVQVLEESGTKLDRQRHRVVKTVATANMEEDNRIREVIRAGFAAGARVLRPADVVIGKYDATLKREGE